ncbi:CesT family type III secretion system chaperone [Herbaspirillum rubrisubalbicans]|uniref:Molecular chaperone Tir n=2 Tax=Herbaspirillum rubrisubalbicans TaxID=80842 RepID=A0AAD0XGP1_9BURK|nr:CesT family type III secretion system chaperone [Herbaspirillum rubrisubalbicans]AEX96970.1 dihydrodipicolinate synthase/N-acetylneuraminate lyase N-terminal protein [Herbaspirillum rubrisubalbicans M1]ALU89602.1 type III chaperone [Herbaspirillum rubrisubalbicans M1]AYR24682.1 molecular chaperone Tir [Herbaspirillum rubrisubalbicans]
MKETDFRTLVADISRLANTTLPEGVTGHAQLEIDGINFTLMDGAAMEEGSIAYFCDFGPIPDNGDRADILQRLLECNLLMFGVGTPTFSVNFETGHAMLMGRAELAQIDAQKLVNAFIHYATQARQWQQNHFLESTRRTRSKTQHRLVSAA